MQFLKIQEKGAIPFSELFFRSQTQKCGAKRRIFCYYFVLGLIKTQKASCSAKRCNSPSGFKTGDNYKTQESISGAKRRQSTLGF